MSITAAVDALPLTNFLQGGAGEIGLVRHKLFGKDVQSD